MDQFEIGMLGNGGLGVQTNYPPYNIRKAGKDKYAIEVALAGFKKVMLKLSMKIIL